MRRKLLIVFLLSLVAAGISSQDTAKMLSTFKRNFAIASLDVKLQILQDAAKTGSEEIGPLYLQAVDFVLGNASFIQGDIRFRQLAMVAVGEITKVEYIDARQSLWTLFQTDEETTMRVSLMNALSVVARGDAEIIGKMNRWQQSQNSVFKTGTIPDLQVVAACVQALGSVGSPSSFPIVFSAMNLGYSDNVTTLARRALLSIQGDFKQLLLGILKSSPLSEKKSALQMALRSEKLDDDEKGEVAEFALDTALSTSASDVLEQEASREMRYEAVSALSVRKWADATEQIVEHFNSTLAEYE